MTDSSRFVVGGDVQASDGIYIKRSADDELFNVCLAGTFAYVLASRQIGKSSLKNEVAQRLIEQGIRVGRIDLNRIGQEVKDIDDWYFNLVDQIASSLELMEDIEQWWDSKSSRLSVTNKFLKFLDEVILAKIKESIVIFIDEIDMTLDLNYRDDFFASIRVIHNDRSQNSNYRRLTFVLLGVATPDELIKDNKRTPFNIGKSIVLNDFTREECEPFRQEIEAKHPGRGNDLFGQIYDWTNGHPYLTQKLCSMVVSSTFEKPSMEVDELVNRAFLLEGDKPEDNIRFVQTRVLGDSLASEMLSEYRQILVRGYIPDNEKSIAINHLKLYGLVLSQNGRLAIRNKIYATIFNSSWVRNAISSLSTIPVEITKIEPDFFVVGGTVPIGSPSYVTRSADKELLNYVLKGQYCSILTGRQMGKSSLMVRAASQLRNQGIQTAIVDISVFGVTSADELYLGLLTQIQRRLRLDVDVFMWWQGQSGLSPIIRFNNFFREVALREIAEPIVIFIDEIDLLLYLVFGDDFFASLRSLFNMRAEDPNLTRLTFVLLGAAQPAELIKDSRRTPFNITRPIVLDDFTLQESLPLQKGLEAMLPRQGTQVYSRIFYWTSGHPYLTQRLCRAVVENLESHGTEQQVDLLVKTLYLSEEAKFDSNLRFVEDVINMHPNKREIFSLYRSIWSGQQVRRDGTSAAQNQLILAGLVKDREGQLDVRNQIYRSRFNLDWINENMSGGLFGWLFKSS